MMRKLQWLRAQINGLVHQAARRSDPILYANVLCDNLPDYITEAEIIERLQAPDALAQLSQLDQRVSRYAPWFDEFRTAALEILQSPDEPYEPETDEPGPSDPMQDDTLI